MNPEIKDKKFGIIDADLLDNGTRHPNLVVMKIAGYLKKCGVKYQLIFKENVNINHFDYIYISKVFTFTREPNFLLKFRNKSHIHRGGTGYYAEINDTDEFLEKRNFDMQQLEKDPLLDGISLKHQMPDYAIYDSYIDYRVKEGRLKKSFSDYLDFSIGFLTRGCIRKCPFCVNRDSNCVNNYSDIEDFIDVNRPKIYLWDDNFLASKNWKELLLKIMETKKPFQFRQGLDIRFMTVEKAEMLSRCNYYGDYIFAFDQIKDKEIIETKLAIWKRYSKHKTTKLFLFCGYKIEKNNDDLLINDVIDLFKRIEVLMRFGCLGYIMRHQDYNNHELGNIYTQIARWCNQPQFYKKMSFREFIERNQYWTKTQNECMSLRTYKAFIARFPSYKEKLDFYFNMKYEMINQYK